MPRSDPVMGATAHQRDDEVLLRDRLGIPAAAERVMVVTESSHWDPNWLLTSSEYFRLCVRPTLDRAIDALLADPRRVFSLECVFFADLYWEQRPERRAVFRQLVNDGRLRFTGSGVTTPDTLLPEDELLLRDLLTGQEWLRSRGMTREPPLLYLPDSFGHSPGTPSLLAAAGLRYAAICRIDGMRFPGADMESSAGFPRPGTSAELLIAEGTADFVWRGSDGSEVLTHWHTYGYGHGDMLASGGLSRALGLPTAWPDRRERHVARRIEGYIDQLTPMARTPYLLLAIGFDFVRPVPRLGELIDRWNTSGYERSGTWLVNAGLDDYLDLVSCHRDVLPTISLDPNPYWSGFYASRPSLKAACKDLGRRLVYEDHERVTTALLGGDRSTSRSDAAHQAAWWTAVTANHHDFVTGTAPDRIAKGEQSRMLRSAVAGIQRPNGAADGARAARSAIDGNGPAASGSTPKWSRDGARVTVITDSFSATFDESLGGALVSLVGADGREQLYGPSLVLNSYRDSGGLWRMGHEFNGGHWGLDDTSARHRASITVSDHHESVVLTIVGSLDDRPTELSVDLNSSDSVLVVRTSLAPPARRTVTLSTRLSGGISTLAMHQPGGMVHRGLRRWYDPTFWPLHSFAAVLPEEAAGRREEEGSLASGPFVIAPADPSALHATGDGTVETVIARTAIKEIAFGVVPVLAPAWGRKWGTQTATLAMQRQVGDDPAATIEIGRDLSRRADRTVGRRRPRWLLEIDDPLVEIIAMKEADRGHGIVARLRNWAVDGSSRMVKLTITPELDATIDSASLVDSNERELDDLTVHAGVVHMEVVRHLSSVRLLGGWC